MTDIDIYEYYKNKNFNYKCIRWFPEEIKQYLLNRFNDYTCEQNKYIHESLYRIINNIEIAPKCPYCNKSRKFKSITQGYLQTCCSNYCTWKLGNETFKKNHNGLVNVFQLESTKQIIQNTLKEKYGEDIINPSQVPKIREKIETSLINLINELNKTLKNMDINLHQKIHK